MAERVGVHDAITRADCFGRVVAVGSGLASGAILAAGLAPAATSSQSAAGDLAVLNFALAFEQLQADFYARALRASALTGEWRRFAEVVGGHEQAHVAFLRRQLGSNAHPAPRFELTPAALHPAQFPPVAIALEDAGVALYNGQAANLTPATLAAAAEIVSVEARHAAWARDLAGSNPAPLASDSVAATPTDVQALLARAGVRTRS